ncbi:MAG: hypothetical protein AB1797_03680 [bacterium]
MRKKQWHPFFSQILKNLFEPKGFKVETEVEVGQLPMKIDIVVIKKGKEADLKSLPLVFQSFTDYNLLEYKSPDDRFSPDDFDRLFAYTLLYKIKERISSRQQINVYALVCGGIKGIEGYIQKNGHYLAKIKDGLYFADFGFNFYLIQLDRLELIPENYRLIPFGGKELVKGLIERVEGEGREGLIEVFELGLYLYPEEFKEVRIMLKTLAERPDILREITEKIGLERFIEGIGEERLIRSIGEERFIQSLGKEEVIRSLGKEEIIRSLGEEEVIRSIGEEKLLKDFINLLGKEKIKKMLEGN